MESIERFLCMGRGWWCGIFFLHTHWVIPQSSHHGGERRGGSVCRVKEPRLSGQSSLCWRKNGGGEKRQISSGESKKLKIWADCRRRRVVLDTAWTPRWKLYVCVCVFLNLWCLVFSGAGSISLTLKILTRRLLLLTTFCVGFVSELARLLGEGTVRYY